jgi:hypothetical protein
VLISQALAPASSSAARNGNVIDSADYEGICFILDLGDVASGGTVNMKIQRDDLVAFGSPTDITGAALVQITDTGDNKLYIIDVRNPLEQFLRCVVTGATAAHIGGVMAIHYGKRGTRPAVAAAVQNVQVMGV